MVRRGVPRVPTDPALVCPCGPVQPYAVCCGPLHQAVAWAPTAEALMRSRFSAFAVRDAAYLQRTWHLSTRPPLFRLDSEQRWVGLEILGRTGGGLLDAVGTVEFRAHYWRRGQRGVLHEHSRFVREEGRWTYLGPVPAGVLSVRGRHGRDRSSAQTLDATDWLQ